MFKSSSTSLILLGVLSVIVGIIAIAWPSVTIAERKDYLSCSSHRPRR